MKRISIIFIAFSLIGIFSCEEKKVIQPGFEDSENMTIYDFIIGNDSLYSHFMDLLKSAEIDKTLSAYNPHSPGYTLFLPDNAAIQRFISTSNRFSSFEEMLADKNYASSFCRYHVVNYGINSTDFPFGALPEYTLSNDLLTVSFVLSQDSAYYKINNQAPVIKTNIELSNGYVHLISEALNPITYTTYDWIEQHPGYTIFKSAVDATGFTDALKINMKNIDEVARPFTLLLEHDSIYNNAGIFSLDDLIGLVSPINSNYTDPLNPLYNYVGYHMIEESFFLDDFVGVNSNYTTHSEVPVHINGNGLDITINKGKVIFDTIIEQLDTIIIDYTGFYFDDSNILTQSGVIHFVNQVLTSQKPTRAIQTFEFYGEPLFEPWRNTPGSYQVDNPEALNNITWTGVPLVFVEHGNDYGSGAWGEDYLKLDGDFTITYTLPKIIQGTYTLFIQAHAYSSQNALIEVFIDGINIGGFKDLSSGGSEQWPFHQFELGAVDFLKYESHVVEVRSLIPGRFLWDHIRFEPK